MADAATVWIVWDYSDYYGPHVHNICATEEVAKAVAAEGQKKAGAGYGPFEVEEYPVATRSDADRG